MYTIDCDRIGLGHLIYKIENTSLRLIGANSASYKTLKVDSKNEIEQITLKNVENQRE